MQFFCPNGRYAVGIAGLILLSLGSEASARALPVAAPVHLPPVTMHSMDAVQNEIMHARTSALFPKFVMHCSTS